MSKIINKRRICDGSKIRRGEHWQSCVEICDEKDCPQQLVKHKGGELDGSNSQV